MDQEERRTGLGGTDAAAIMGLSPWRDPVDVWQEKAGHPMWRPQRVTGAMRWGILLEPLLRAEYARDTGVEVVPAPPRSTFDEPEVAIWSEDRVRFAHPDGLAGEGVFEGKTGSRREDWDDGVPVYYRIQVQQYLDILDRPWADVSVLLPGGDFRTYREERDAALQGQIREAAATFWNDHVVKNVPPGPVDTTTLTLEGDEEAAAAVLALAQTKADLAFWKEAEEELKEKVKEMMGPAGYMTVPGYRVDYTTTRAPVSVGWEQVATSLWNTIELVRRFAEHLPEEAQQHLDPGLFTVLQSMYSTTGTPTRPLTVRAIKEAK
jgi:predicted phage-related endonuclease